MAKPDIAPVDTDPAIIVFGRDRTGKPHASFFGCGEASLAEKAATLMEMQILPVSTDEHRAVAAQLPPGRVFASGRAFVPLVRAELYARLVDLSQPVSEQKPPAGSGRSDLGSTQKNPVEAAPTSTAAHASEISPATGGLPCSWADIGVGSVVLATTAPMDGWYESVVTDVKGHDLFVLKWRDWPDEPAFVRRRWHLGLLHPAGGG
ncbi:hypothetical protein AA309_05470 [Microvirga vignae]|uniref:Uncharacterized protein n=1 Tax=Microvirga vignae TaxID=1225564 RepID=A0A0H1RMR2_9HYPH|nr:hypothetical protein [Microvirga vignae]KLK93932.1 hypothetical protein AA309_05470 [Microvirga vignae]